MLCYLLTCLKTLYPIASKSGSSARIFWNSECKPNWSMKSHTPPRSWSRSKLYCSGLFMLMFVHLLSTRSQVLCRSHDKHCSYITKQHLSVASDENIYEDQSHDDGMQLIWLAENLRIHDCHSHMQQDLNQTIASAVHDKQMYK